MYRCSFCKTTDETPPFRADRFDEAVCPVCRCCGERVEKPAEVCRSCGKELFPGEHVYEAEEKIYCADCVTEMTL